MSIDATRWAWKQLVNPSQKIVLLALADRAGENHECWPSVARLCLDTGLARSTIFKIFQELENLGLIRRTQSDGKQSVYTLIGVSGRENNPNRIRHVAKPAPRQTRPADRPVQQIDGSTRQTRPADRLNPSTTWTEPVQQIDPESIREPKENPKRVRARRTSPPKSAFGEFGNVKLTAEEYQRLVAEYGEADTAAAIAKLDLHLGARKGADPYRSHYLAMRKWVFNALAEDARRLGSGRNSAMYGQAMPDPAGW